MRLRHLAPVLTLVALAFGARAGDLLIHGGPIYVEADKPPVAALLVRDGHVAFTGSLAVAKRRAVKPRDIDLKGAAAYPGFVDSHAHLMSIGFRELTLNLEGVVSVPELQTRLKAWNAAHPGTEPLFGRGWIETHWPEARFPNRADLDAVVADRPVLLERADGHAVVANSAMLALAGVTRATVDPAGGQVLRDATGDPTGILVDNATDLANAKLPKPSLAQQQEAAKLAVALYASRGWTGMHNVSVAAADVAILKTMDAAGALPIRVDNFMDLGEADEVLSHGPSGQGLVRVDGIKLYMDGALGSRGAALLAPYSDSPGSSGLLLTPAKVIADALTKARKAHAQVATHAIGDRGNRLVLDAYEQAFADDPAALNLARWRVEHAQIVSAQDIPRFAKLGVIASMQPSHAIGDLYFAPARLGPDRLKEGYAWHDLWISGAHLTAGTDAPVEKGDPLIEYYAAVYRHDLGGYAGPNWGSDEVLTRAQALAALTREPAYAVFAEKTRGDLKVGKVADITAFSVDLMTVPVAAIPKAHAVLTVVAGRVVFDAR